MGDRRLFSTSRMFETGHYQNMHTEQSYMHLGRAGAAHSGSFSYGPETLQIEGVNFPLDRDSAVRSNEIFPSSIGTELPYRQVPMSGSSYDPFRQQSAARSSFPVTQSYTGSFSSDHYRHAVCGMEEGIMNPTTGDSRGSHKRKWPAVSTVYERGSTSQYSSGAPEHWPPEFVRMTPSYGAGTLSVPGESFQRNVRSRSTLGFGVNRSRTFVSSSASNHPISIERVVYHPGTVSVARETTQEHNRIPFSSIAQQRTSVSDTSGFRRDTVQFGIGSSGIPIPMDINGYHPDRISRRNAVHTAENLRAPVIHAARGGQYSYGQRPVSAYRSMYSNQQPVNVAAFPENALLSVPETYSSSYSRPLSMIGWHNTDRNERSRILHQRLDFMTVNTTGLYDSQNILDQHRDMRLEVDDMSYEELLALGERIGNVNTGLSEGSMSKCLREKVHYASNQIQEKDTCVICLEEYENKDKVATLVSCSHKYHTGCIKKWLSTKNACPICKAPAQADS